MWIIMGEGQNSNVKIQKRGLELIFLRGKGARWKYRHLECCCMPERPRHTKEDFFPSPFPMARGFPNGGGGGGSFEE